MTESEQLNHYYYIKHRLWKERQIDRKLDKGWAGSATCDIEQVLDEVPTYDEYKAMQEENTQLKELLKECSYRIDWRIRTSDNETQKLFDKISQVLGEE